LRGLDTNVLVRHLVRDDPEQTAAVDALFERAATAGELLIVGILTLMETEWALRSRGGLSKGRILEVFKQLLEVTDIAIENPDTVELALHWFENSNAEFADCLMIAQYQCMGCSAMLTFDGEAAKIPGGELLGV
jgi:predicted nucleic-acid-binding protein